MKVVIPGGTGFLGSHLAPRLRDRGDQVIVLTRGRSREADGIRFVNWDGAHLGDWAEELDGAQAVVHLAGKRVDCRPTRHNIDQLIRSRVEPVLAVGRACREVDDPPGVWVQAATLAIFGDTGDRQLDDATVPDGTGPPQMVQVAMAWEHAVREAAAGIDRTVLLRMGVVLGGGDAATERLKPLVRAGLGGPIAGGGQWLSWLAVEDAMRLIVRGIDDPSIRGPVIACSPEPVTNATHMAALRRHLDVPVGLPVPGLATRLGAWAMGSDPALALTSRRARPSRLLDHGFSFATPNFDAAVCQALADVGGPSSPPRRAMP